LLTALRERAHSDLADQHQSLDYGLIYADLVPENVMTDGPNLNFIDFDDGGYGFRGFEVATALFKHMSAPDYQELKPALVDGYTSERCIDLALLDLFLALRAATYVGWNITRMTEDGGEERNVRFINSATKIAAGLIM